VGHNIVPWVGCEQRLSTPRAVSRPAIPARLRLGVEVQREGAADPAQHGRSAPLCLPKRELGRFLQRIEDSDRTARERAAAAAHQAAALAAKEAAKASDAAEAREAAAQAIVLPAGTRRASFRAGMSYVSDASHRACPAEEG